MEQLAPFVLVAVVLASLLLGFSLRTLGRRSRSGLLAPPTALATADQARRAHLDEAALLAARDQPIVVVYIDGEVIRIEVGRAP